MGDKKKTDTNFKDPFCDNNFDVIFDELYTPLCRYCMKLVIDAEAAEDIVQDIFSYVWENWKQFEKGSSIKAYLFSSVKNRSINYLKKYNQKDKFLSMEDFNDSMYYFGGPTVEELLECKELEIILEKALASLPEKCRAIFTLKRFAEMSNREIADHLNLSIKTVEAQTTIAIKKLSRYVEKNWGSSSLFLFSIYIENI